MPVSRRVVAVALLTMVSAIACGGGGGKSEPNIPGVVVEPASGRGHQQGQIEYSKHPPSGGNHNPVPLTCGVYDQQPPDEFALHSLEHGAVWIAYDPAMKPSDVAVLRAFGKQDHVIVSPYAGMSVPITVVAWEHRLELQSANDPRLAQFVDAFRNAKSAPEAGGVCRGVGQPAP